MTAFHVEVVRVGAIEKHPNADALSLTKVGDYPVVFRTGDFTEGDLAVYVPVDAVVAPNDPRFEFLAGHNRIRAKRLRGIFSMGLLTNPEPDMQPGDDVADRLHITNYEPPEPGQPGASHEFNHVLNEVDHGIMPAYDLEALRRWPNVLVDGEEVSITEKIHGENARFVHDGERLWVGSHHRIKRDREDSRWWNAARAHNLADKLANVPHVAIYGEVHGYTGGFSYGVPVGGTGLRLFDACDVKTRRWFDVEEVFALAERLGVPTVPELYRGPWSRDLATHADGASTLGAHLREGFVVRPIKERFELGVGRVVLKRHGEAFLLRKGA